MKISYDKSLKIALIGKSRSGKDTVAPMFDDLYFIDTYEYLKFMSFGYKMVRSFQETFPNIERIPRPIESYRKYAQYCREIDENVWVNFVDEEYRSHIKYNKLENFIITDLRQENEYEWCKKHGFIFIKIDCDEKIRKERAIKSGEECLLNADAEKYTDKLAFDYLIKNNGSLKELKEAVKEIYNEIVS